jgi:hypothetical protein
MKLIVLLSVLVSFSRCSSERNALLSARDDLIHLPRSNRLLKAAQVESQIGKRDIAQALRCDHELHYVDGKYLQWQMQV